MIDLITHTIAIRVGSHICVRDSKYRKVSSDIITYTVFDVIHNFVHLSLSPTNKK